jgi:hypothetical protein
MEFDIKDSGERQDFETGAVRDSQEGKGLYDCLPFEAIRRLAVQLEKGAHKYNKNNWRKGMPLSRFLSSALRHLMKYADGHRDEDHLAAALFNVAALIETERAIRQGRVPLLFADLEDYGGGYEEDSDEPV